MNVVKIDVPDDLEKALAQFRRTLPHVIEYHRLAAKIKKASFDALIDAGFTESQALELCRHTS